MTSQKYNGLLMITKNNMTTNFMTKKSWKKYLDICILHRLNPEETGYLRRLTMSSKGE